MNKNCFRVVWNRKLGLSQVVSEMARSDGKTKSRPRPAALVRATLVARLSALAGAVLLAWALPLPYAFAQINSGTIQGEHGNQGDVGTKGDDGSWATWNTDPTSGQHGENGVDGAKGSDGLQLGSASAIFTNNGVIRGGRGGDGGAGGAGGNAGGWGGWAWRNTTGTLYHRGDGGDGGNGGRGGDGVVIGAVAVTFVNNGTVVGSNGGAGGSGGLMGEEASLGTPQGRDGDHGLGAQGGAGIRVYGSGSNIINAGRITPGFGEAAAIRYEGSATNLRLELRQGSVIDGLVDASNSTGKRILALGSAAANQHGVFDVSTIGSQYLNFNAFEKTGDGSWELTENVAHSTPWTIYDGSLLIHSDRALGLDTGTLVFGAAGVDLGLESSRSTGRLAVLDSFGMNRDIQLDGNGGIDVAAGKTLTSYGNIDGSGVLNLAGEGAIQFANVKAHRIGGLTLDSGELNLAQGVRFELNGAYTQTGGTLRIDPDGSRNNVIAATTASLGGALVVDNYRLDDIPDSVSQLAGADRVLIATTGGISGAFFSAPEDLEVDGLDFLRYGGRIQGNEYVLGIGLAWDSANTSHGRFTLNGENFTVDRALANRADGAGDLIKNGTGTLSLSQQNTYTGTTTVNGGVLALTGTGDISTSSAVHAGAGATLDVSSVFSRSAQLNNLSGDAGSALQLGDTELDIAMSRDLAFAGVISGNGSVTKSGDGTLTLDASNTYTGLTRIKEGTVIAGTENVFAPSRGLELGADATFRLNNRAQSVAQIQSGAEGGGNIELGTANLTLSGSGASTATFSGNISGAGDLIKEGSYTQYLSGDGALGNSGDTIINDGVLALRNIVDQSRIKPITLNGGWLDLSDSEAIKDWSGLIIDASGAGGRGGVIGYGDVMRLQDGDFNATIGAGGDTPDARDGMYVVKDTEGETIMGGGGNTYVGNTRLHAGILTVDRDALLGDTDISREVVLNGGVLRVNGSFDSKRALLLEADGTVDVTAGNSTEWQGGISGRDGTAGYGFSKTGAGTLILSGASDYLGDTVIEAGTLALKDKADLHGGRLIFGEADGNVFDVSGLEGAFGSIGELVDNGTNSVIALGNTTLAVRGGGTFNGVIQDDALSGELAGGLLKTGDNLLTLNGVNTYTGDTTVADGVLALSGTGSIADSASLRLAAAGAVFDISATAAGAGVRNLRGVSNSRIVLGEQTLEVDQNEDTWFAGDIEGSGGLTKTGDGALTLMGDTAYTGDTVLSAGKLILDGSYGGAQLNGNVSGASGTELVLQRGAVLTGSVDPIDMSIDASSTWNMTADSEVERMTLAGLINMVEPGLPMTAGRTLTANNWDGQGGTVNLYAILDDSDSVSDQIRLDGGNASGTTSLNILWAGGFGAVTEGDGIKVVDAINGGTTETEAFRLARKVYAGAYEYRLRRGGEMDADDWFLVSAIRQESSLFSALGNQGLRYGEAVLGSLQERMGNIDELTRQGDTYAWGRTYGQTVSQGATRNTVGRDEEEIAGFQVGSDVLVSTRDNDRSSMGLYAAGGSSDARVRHREPGNVDVYAGRNSIKGYSLGGYFTHLDDSGAYADIVLQGTRYSLASNSVDGLHASSVGYGAAGSLELGHSFDLGGGYWLQPQAQVVVQSISMKHFEIEQGARVNVDSSSSVSSRIGVHWSKSVREDDRVSTGWLALHVLNSRGPAPTTVFVTPDNPDMVFKDGLSGTRLKLSTGVSGHVSKRTRVDVRLSAENSIDDSRLSSIGVNVGVKMAF